MSKFVKPQTCKRCKGKGTVPHARDFGVCYGCDGHGKVETDRATLAAKAATLAARTALGAAAFAHSHEAHSGLSALEANEPARLVKAVAAFAAGDARVLPALEDYFRSL